MAPDGAAGRRSRGRELPCLGGEPRFDLTSRAGRPAVAAREDRHMTTRSSTLAPPRSGGAITGRMVVARFCDGRTVKGTTQDFVPNRTTFHIYPGGDESSKALAVNLDTLKALFFVKSFTGRRTHVENYDFERFKGYGRRCRVTFQDGELIAGYITGYSPERPGFFLVPAEANSNNDRVFIVNKAVRSVDWI